MTLRDRLRAVLTFTAMLILLSAGFAGISLLTGYLLRRFQWQVPPLLLSIINPWLTLLFAGFIGSWLARKGPQRRPFDEVREALARIATGDFAIRLNEKTAQPLKDLVASVNQMAGQLGRLESMRQEFVSNVSHEIQSPLTSIRGFAEALRDESLSPEQRHAYLDIIAAESTRLSRMSDNLLTLATLEAAEGELATAPYRLDKQIRNVILACEPQWRDREIEWDIRLEKATITAHEELLGQVWLNLLQNAIKFSQAGGTIAVELRQEADQLQVQVTDHGIGIAPADQLRIFERFYKADKARDRSMGGSGLGLAISRKIVTMHGGRIAVASELGKGTTFTVTLPLRAPAV